MIDIHSHLLPGVDDGSASVEVTIPVLERFGADGVEVVVCTPHLMATDVQRVRHEYYAAVFDDLVARAPAVPSLRRGWEIMLDAPGVDLTSRDLTLGGSTAILVEFPRLSIPIGATNELRRLGDSGLVPVLAHPERYAGASMDAVSEWRGAGAVMQIDATILLGNSSRSRLARQMLQQGLVDCIASDNHGDRRSLGAARDWLLELGFDEQARLLTYTNAQRLLTDERVIPVSPIPRLSRGVIGRLRDLLFRRT